MCANGPHTHTRTRDGLSSILEFFLLRINCIRPGQRWRYIFVFFYSYANKMRGAGRCLWHMPYIYTGVVVLWYIYIFNIYLVARTYITGILWMVFVYVRACEYGVGERVYVVFSITKTAVCSSYYIGICEYMLSNIVGMRREQKPRTWL